MFRPVFIPVPGNQRQTLEFLTNPPHAFMIIRVHQKDEQSAVVMSVHGTTLCRDFRCFSYVGARAKRCARKQLFEAWTSDGVHAEFCVARTITSARSPLRETENLRRVCHGAEHPTRMVVNLLYTKKGAYGDLRNSAFSSKTPRMQKDFRTEKYNVYKKATAKSGDRMLIKYRR